MDQSVIDTLDSHFRYLDEEVTCSRVRPLLPGLLDPSVELRIPTPITVHLDHCPQCASDLENLRGLALGGEQRRRLRGLYEHESNGNLLLCRRAQSRMEAFVHGSLEGIGDDVLDHLSTCPRCRADVYSHRQAILNGLQGPSDGCGKRIATADLFDYAVPGAGMDRRTVQPDALHVRTCRKCLETVQAIHRAVYGVVERPESGVATVYRTVEADRSVSTRPDGRYAGYGVTVEVLQREAGQARARGRMALQRAKANPHVRRILKTAVAAAAVIPLAALFFYTHGTSGITLGEVVHAFGQARNVRAVVYYPVADAIVYELWVARDMNLLGLVREKEGAVYDLPRRQKQDIVSGEILPVDDGELFNVEQIADRCLGFRLADVPGDARWDCVSSDGNRMVYELTWMAQTYTDRTYEAKCEIVVDVSRKLPETLRVFRWEPTESQWECKSMTVFEYLSEAEMVSLMGGKQTGNAGGHR